MFYTQSDRMFTENAEGRDAHNGPRVPLHNPNENGERPHQPEEVGETSSSEGNDDGTWGERDVGGPVTFRHAMLDYEELRKELSQLSKTRSRGTAKSVPRQGISGLRRHISRGSNATGVERTEPERDVEAQAGDEEKAIEEEEEDFQLGDFLKDGHFEKRHEGESAKKVGVIYKNLTVQGVGATTTFVKTLPNAIIGVSRFF